VMATKSALMILEGAPLCPALNESRSICPEVLGTIYTAHYRYVLGICRRFFRQPEDAEDAAAEVFVNFTGFAPKGREAALPPLGLAGAWRHCIDKLRQRKREKSSSLEDTDFECIPIVRFLRHSPNFCARTNTPGQRAVNSSAERYKVPLMLLYYKQMSYSEIARTLNTRLPTLRTMMFRAKVYLRRNCDLSSRAGISQFEANRRGILTITAETESRTAGGFSVIPSDGGLL